MRPELLVRCDARLGEGVCWHPLRQALAWVDILGGRVFELTDGRVVAWECGQMVGMVAPAEGGSYLAALRDGIYRLRPREGLFSREVPAPYDTAGFRFNDGKVDARGRLWVGTLSLRGEERTSALYCWEPGGPVRLVLNGVSISNGIAWSADGRTFYYIDTPARAVQRFTFDEERGIIVDGAVAISFSAEEGLPDGCALDLEGNLWVAHWGGARVTQSDPRTGRRLRSLAFPVRNVTSCVFGGPNCDRLFVSTARCDDMQEDLAGSVFVLQPGVGGLPPHLARAEV